MKDFLGKEIAVGDDVVFVELGYRNFSKGKIVKINAVMILIEYTNTYNRTNQVKQHPSQVIKL